LGKREENEKKKKIHKKKDLLFIEKKKRLFSTLEWFLKIRRKRIEKEGHSGKTVPGEKRESWKNEEKGR